MKIVSMFLILMLVCMAGTSYSVQKEAVTSLVSEDRVLTSPIELHLTSADSPLSNSTVSLNHEDAWLFFDNIKPSVAIANYASKVKIYGETLKAGINGRVAIYGNGSVIMPFSSTFKPLTVYTEENFGGDSQQMTIYTYHNSLGTFDNAIKSFKLKRGYMATLANEADGSGYSRVFIADKEDLQFSVLPDELSGTVSFIRVFKHQWVSKKGKAGWDPHILDGTTYYDWNIAGNSSSDVEYAAIRQHGGWPSWTDINNKQNITHLLGYNEPDRPDQSNMSFDEMIAIWPSFMNSGLRIGSPAYSNAWGGAAQGGGNLFDFINKCDELNYRVDFVALHCYWGGLTPESWYYNLKYIHELTGRPLWITEWNNGANWTTEWWPDNTWELTDANAQKQLDDIKGILTVLDTASFVERYFIYDWVEDRRAMAIWDGTKNIITPAGEYYKANKSQIGYNSKKEVIPHWNYKVPELAVRYLKLAKKIRVEWDDPNGELSKDYKIEKKVNGGAYETIYSGDYIPEQYFLETLDPVIGGTVTYRLSFQTVNGEVIQSNEASYYQTEGEDAIQLGKFTLKNTDLSETLFANKYSAVPVVVLGASSFNNIVPMTQRVSNVSTTSFKFELDPWLYLNNPVLTKFDTLSAMALPQGVYDFDGLKAAAQDVSNVGRDWVSVSFEEPFDVVPIVFCTRVSGANSYPITIGVRNVTALGFEMCLKTEEKQAGVSLLPENINYLAIEPGQGVISGKRVTVGRTPEGSGVSNTSYEIGYDQSYSSPAVFAGLLSAQDNFASTIRYYKSGDYRFKLLKHREASAGISTIQKDDLGWMIMDMAPNQQVTSSKELKQLDSMLFYPNPAENTVHFNLQKPMWVEIFDLSGNKLMQAEVVDVLNVSSLNAGMYLLKVEGYMAAKFIKK